MSGDKRKACDLCQHDEYLPQLVRDFGMEGALVGIEVEANGDPRDGEAWQRFEQRLRRAGL